MGVVQSPGSQWGHSCTGCESGPTSGRLAKPSRLPWINPVDASLLPPCCTAAGLAIFLGKALAVARVMAQTARMPHRWDAHYLGLLQHRRDARVLLAAAVAGLQQAHDVAVLGATVLRWQLEVNRCSAWLRYLTRQLHAARRGLSRWER